jgi:threonine/homoserine/homoserine lactone efflux protein
MLAYGDLPLFLVAALVLLITPGPAVFYIVARSVQQGSLAGIVSAVGVVTGGFIHVLAGTVGLSALVLSSPIAFTTVKYFGALYLVYLGFRALLGKDQSGDPNLQLGPRQLGRVYRDGLLVNLFNPKTILFFIAFLPQFVDSTRDNPGMQFLLLGTIMVSMGLATDSIYAAMAGRASQWLRKTGRRLSYHQWFAGTVYLGLGIFTLLVSPARQA